MIDRLFQKNLDLWAKSSPKEAVLLPYVDCNCLTHCSTNMGEPNLKRLYGSSIVFYHSQDGAKEEAEQWFASLPLKDVPLIIVYGIGLGYYYDAALKWLKKDRKRSLIFLEDDLSVIHEFLKTKLATQLLQDRQAQLLFFENLKDEEGSFEMLYWNTVLTRVAVSALGCYAEKKGHFLDQMRHKIAHDAAIKNALVDEYLRYGGAFFINYYQNMLDLHDSYLGNRFFGKFNQVPAIICGAGPSLAKNVELLGTLLNKAVIFAGGSSLNALNAASFQPHFGAGIDPNPMQLARLSSSQGYEVPFFYRNRLFHDAFKMIHGPRLYVTGSGGYDVAEYFEEKFGIKEEFLDEGHNVVNFCVQVAEQMGCNPIIFVGLDLAFTEMKEYAPGVVEDATVTQTEILDIKDEDDKALLREDINGRPVYTLWKWIAESEWISDFAKGHPSVTLINATEGGLGFPDIPNQTLQEVADKHLLRSYELKSRIHGETEESVMPQVTYPKIVHALEELSQGLEKATSYLNVLIEESKTSIDRLKNGEPAPGQSGRAALAEIELAEEPAYKYVIDIFNAVYSRILNHELHEINTGRSSEKLRSIKRLELNTKKLTFLSEVAKVNQELIRYAFEENAKRPKGEKYGLKSIPKHDFGIYRFEDTRLFIQDNELGLQVDELFNPVIVPKDAKDGVKLESGHTTKVFYDARWKLSECFLEINGEIDGQCLLYYPSGSVKEEVFYRHGRLHGPATVFSEKGELLAKSYFLNGKQEGLSLWYYSSGNLHSVQRYRNDIWNGQQEFFYQDGSLKTLMNYIDGKLVEMPILLQPDGSLAIR